MLWNATKNKKQKQIEKLYKLRKIEYVYILYLDGKRMNKYINDN